MATATRNPYVLNSPEWQLWEIMDSSEAQARAFAIDADNYRLKASAAKTKAEEYKVALDRLIAAKKKE